MQFIAKVVSFRGCEDVVSSLLLTVPVFSTLTGGVLALRLRTALAMLVAFSTGLLLAATFLDLLPEAIALQTGSAGSAANILGIALLSFLGFLLLQSVRDSLVERLGERASHRTWGRISGGLLVAHSFRDGLAIGVSYAASHPAGYIVAAGIAAHDIGDGVNTVLLSTRGQAPGRVDYALLAADCLAPLAGALSTAWFHVSARGSAILLAVASGFFLQMIAGELLPQLRGERSPRLGLVGALLAGVLLIYVATRLAL
jgi:zinc transporter ZupT